MNRVLGSLLAVLALGGAWLLFPRGTEDSAPRPEDPGPPPGVLQPAGPAAPDRPAPADPLTAPGSLAARTPAATPNRLGSRLRDPSGAPVAAARITWTPLRPEFLGPWVGWALQRWDEIERSSLEAVSSPDGAFAFPAPPAGSAQHPGALWITDERHLPELVLLGRAGAGPAFPERIELRPAQAISVRVTDGQGAAVEGAEVRQMSPVPQSSRADTYAPQARRVLVRKTLTDASGSARVAAWDGPLLLAASLGGRTSEVWIGQPRARIELALHATFEVGGSVDFAGGAELEGQQRIVCTAVVGSQSQELAIAPVENGGFGPLRLPLVPADRFRFRLEGWNVEIRERTILPPAAGDSLRVDFEARAGLDVWTRVLDEHDEPLMDGETAISWEQEGGRVELLGYPREDGYIQNRGVPPGIIEVNARAPGFVPYKLGPVRVPADPPTSYSVVLVPGRLVQGRVVRGGRPVEDFELTFWPNDTRFHETLAFRERSDGSFSLHADADEGVSFVATAAGSGPSDVALSQPGDAAPLTLELHEAVRGTGVVVDAESGEPLPNARLQTFVTGGMRAIAPWGSELDVARDGSFDRAAFAVGRARTRFSAPGYSQHWAETYGRAGEVLDFGSIALARRQSLTLRVSSDVQLDPGAYSVTGTGAEPIPTTTFDSNGTVVVAAASAGVYYLIIDGPDRLQIRHTAILEPGEDWIVEIPVDGSRALRVAVETGAWAPEDLVVMAHLPSPDGRALQVSAWVPPERVVEFRGVLPGDFDVRLMTRAGASVGSSSGRLLERDTVTQIALRPFATAHRFRVRDREGRPAAGAELGVWDPRTAAGNGCFLDADGLGALTGLQPGPYMARVVHPTLGSHFNIPVTVPAADEELIELVFAPDRAVEVQVRDGFEPLAGVSCWLWEEHELYGIPPATTDAAGRVRWGPLGAGRFRVKLSHPEVWAAEALVEARAPGEVSEVQARRIGNVELELRDALGAALGGRELELTSLEFGAAVSDWLREGRATSSTGGVRTAGDGSLTLQGLPRGRYAWSLAGAGGEFDVPPGATRSVRLVVP